MPASNEVTSAALSLLSAHLALGHFSRETITPIKAFRWPCVRHEVESFGFQAYRVMSRAGLADLNPEREALYREYLDLKAWSESPEANQKIKFRRSMV